MSNLRYSEEVESVEERFVLDLKDSNEVISAGDGLLLTGDRLGRAKCFTQMDLTNTCHRMQIQEEALSSWSKCRFHQEVRFLGYVVASQGVRIQEERIEADKTWLEPQSVRDIQVFVGFDNFYQRFIQRFSEIAAPLTLMLKTSPEATRSKSMEVVVESWSKRRQK